MQLWGYSGNGVSTVTLQGVRENIFSTPKNRIKLLMYLSKHARRARICAPHHGAEKIFAHRRDDFPRAAPPPTFTKNARAAEQGEPRRALIHEGTGCYFVNE
jgi:hypothetical protein